MCCASGGRKPLTSPLVVEPRRIVWAFARNTEAQRIAKEAGGRVEIGHSKADVVGAASQGVGH